MHTNVVCEVTWISVSRSTALPILSWRDREVK